MPLRRIEQETGVRRETAGAYLKRRIGVRPPGHGDGEHRQKRANETEVTTGSDAAKPVNTVHLDCKPQPPTPTPKPSFEGKSNYRCTNNDEVFFPQQFWHPIVDVDSGVQRPLR